MPTTWKIRRWSEVFENHKTRIKPGMKMKRLQSPIDFLSVGYGAITLRDDRAAIYGCWAVTAMVAAQCSPRGVLVREDGRPHTPETVALITRMRVEDMESAWEFLKEIGWLLPQDDESNGTQEEPRPSIAPRPPLHRPPTAPPSPPDRPGRDRGAPILDPDPELDPKMDPPQPPLRGDGGRSRGRNRKQRREGPPYDPCPACEDGAVWDRLSKPPRITATCRQCARGRDRARDIRASRDGERDSEARRLEGAKAPRTVEPGEDPQALGAALGGVLDELAPTCPGCGLKDGHPADCPEPVRETRVLEDQA